FSYNDIFGGGSGARPTKDGRDAQDTHLARFRNTPTEMIEHEYPVRVWSYELLPDTGGAGKYRGALGLAREVEVLTDGVVFSRYGDRQKNLVPGAQGGREGQSGRFVLNPGKNGVVLKSKGVDALTKGDVLRIETPGGGGFGPVEEREVSSLAADLRDGKTTHQFISNHFGEEMHSAALELVDDFAKAAE
ncbi:MAG: hydantoinase B/oxoprolinase family protein, partial [Pseudomonadota bacterium]|nr:hydantoinase B/oxoprolinase family protein [Pseudomonadota bacterium]